MDIALWSFIVNTIQTFVIVVSMIFVFFQVRQFNKTLHQDAYSKAVDYYVKTNELLLEKPALTKFFYAKNEGFLQLTEEERDFYNYLGLIVGFYEHLYLLSLKKWIDHRTWESWERWLAQSVLPAELFKVFWKNEGELFHVGFYQYVNELCKKHNVTI
jgi:hypothetical protein